MSTRTPTSYCASCGYRLDASTSISSVEIEPSPGDLSVCLNCGDVSEFNDILVCVPCPEETLNKLSPKTKTMLTKLQNIVRERGHMPDYQKK